ncbi:MAG: helix-turn-helix transcriptional regulator [Pyrinomonadaceae bacterium]
MSIFDYVAKQIRELRTNYNHGEGLSQDALAAQIQVAANTISRWENGIYRPSLDDLEKLARFFAVSISTFFPPETYENDSDQLMTLLRAARHLDPEDLEEITKYAEFRRARRMYAMKTRKSRGKGGKRR